MHPAHQKLFDSDCAVRLMERTNGSGQLGQVAAARAIPDAIPLDVTLSGEAPGGIGASRDGLAKYEAKF